MNDADEYQRWTETTWHSGEADEHYRRLHAAVGLFEEAGEVAGKLKRTLRGDLGKSRTWPDGEPMGDYDNGMAALHRSQELLLELGDVAYYLARLADECGFTLSEVFAANRAKLDDRQRRGKLAGKGDGR